MPKDDPLTPASPPPLEGGRRGTVLGSTGGVYPVRIDDGPRVDAFIRGRLKLEARTGDRIVAGDRVLLRETGDEGWIIDEVSPRNTELVRAGFRGHRPKAVAANLDLVLIVLSAVDPPFRAAEADRFLIVAESCGIMPLLLITKLDRPEARAAVEESIALYRSIGYAVLELSAPTGLGLERLRDEMRGCTSTLIGPSGVGKSTLVNALAPGLDLRTAPVGHRGGRGRHTTVSARLIELPGEIRVIDTPGFSEVRRWSPVVDRPDDLFPELRERSPDCRFRVCTHRHEPGCAVLEALESEAIDRGRYGSYLRLIEGEEG